jgi:hypothetical protein
MRFVRGAPAGCRHRLGGSAGDDDALTPDSSRAIRYKDGDQWKDGSNYGAVDLLALSEAAREASAKNREMSKAKAQTR